MSETPRNEENPELRDPTAPSEPPPGEVPPFEPGSGETTPIDTSHTQEVPPPPAPPATPLVTPGPPPSNPYASPQPGAVPPGPPPQNPYGVPPTPASQPVGPQAGGPPGPYGAPGYGQPGYGTPGYGPPAYGTPAYGAPGYGPPGYAPARSLSGNTIALLVVSGLTTFGCLFGIVAFILAIVAATHKDDPAASARFTRWGWIALVAGFVLAAAILIISLVAIGFSTNTSTYNSGA